MRPYKFVGVGQEIEFVDPVLCCTLRRLFIFLLDVKCDTEIVRKSESSMCHKRGDASTELRLELQLPDGALSKQSYVVSCRKTIDVRKYSYNFKLHELSLIVSIHIKHLSKCSQLCSSVNRQPTVW